jgi:hypothetical protein
MDPDLIELFVDGKEDGLPDSGRLDGLGLGAGAVLFMLQRAGWLWESCGSDITLSGEGLVATVTKSGGGYQMATGGELMTEGRHYWEVEVAWEHGDSCDIYLGAVRPGLDHSACHHCDEDGIPAPDTYFLCADSCSLMGHGKDNSDEQGECATGDRIGVLLDLDAGWLRFYHNGKRCGPGFTEGVTGPLVRAVQLAYFRGPQKATALPSAVPPDGAGDADEPWQRPPEQPE